MSSSSCAGAADASDSGESSPDSRGKRRRVDAFEFAPRVAAQNSDANTGGTTLEWSDEATFALIDAWGDRVVRSGHRSLTPDEWSSVAAAVTAAGTNCSESQCRNHIDALRRKFNELSGRGGARNWVFFEKIDSLMRYAPPSQTPVPPQIVQTAVLHPRSGELTEPRLPWGVDNGVYVCENINREMGEGPGDTGTDFEDDNGDESEWLSMSMAATGDLDMLSESVRKFGETYERVETSRRLQMEEVERMRKEFYDDLEMEKRQILEHAKAEIRRICGKSGEADNGDGLGEDKKIHTTP